MIHFVRYAIFFPEEMALVSGATQSILHNHRGAEQLKRLFWQELYDCVNEPASIGVGAMLNATLLRANHDDWPHTAISRSTIPLCELRTFFAQADTEDLKAQMSLLESTFRRSLTRTLSTELNAIKRAEVIGLQLVQELSQLYTRYHLDQQRQQQRDVALSLPFIVCSELFV